MAWTVPTSDLLRDAALTLAVMTWLARRLSGGRARRHPADSDHPRRPAVHLADRGRRHPSGVDRPCRHRHDSDAADRGGRRDFEPVARHRDFACFGRCDFSHRLSGEKSRSGINPDLNVCRCNGGTPCDTWREAQDQTRLSDDDQRSRADRGIGAIAAPASPTRPPPRNGSTANSSLRPCPRTTR